MTAGGYLNNVTVEKAILAVTELCRNICRVNGLVHCASGRHPLRLLDVIALLGRQIEYHFRIQQRIQVRSILKQQRDVDQPGVQDRRLSKQCGAKSTGITLELDSSAVGPSHPSHDEKRTTEGERRSHRRHDINVPRISIGWKTIQIAIRKKRRHRSDQGANRRPERPVVLP